MNKDMKLLMDKDLCEKFGKAVKAVADHVLETVETMQTRKARFNKKKEQVEEEMKSGGRKGSGRII